MSKLGKLSLRELLTMYFQHKELREDTKKSYVNVVRIFEKYYGNRVVIDDISVDTVLAFRHHVLHQKLNSHQTWNTYNRHFAALFNFAIEHSLTQSLNPFNKMKVKIITKKKKTLDITQIDHAIAFLESKVATETIKDFYYPTWFWRSVINTFRYTGIRLNQLIHIRLCDLDDKKILFLRGDGSKTHTERYVPLIDSLYHDLVQLKQQLVDKGVAQEQQLFNIYYFKSSKKCYNQMSAMRIHVFFQQLSQSLNYPVSPHRFRHTLASQLMKKPDRNIHLVKELLGHSSINTTLEYIEADMEQLKNCLLSYSNFSV
ncbi:site-specific recombinase XerD [Orbus hercynius]|uniref:Site-specific recombinase XerD n=1 Tax=Orbus hercynius TaxID=593135 RepID=A0A495RDI8_9GAMM|nr:site-specific integrase [Orbus hercynius]RKS85294.1 site-specific recombinase XerD [Orbus hercynius]